MLERSEIGIMEVESLISALSNNRILAKFLEALILSIAVASITLFSVPAHASGETIRKAQCGKAKYRYILFAPAHHHPLPAILLLHGAGDTPEPMVDAWKKLAKTEQIALIAPDLPRDAKFEPLAPGVFHCVMEDAKHAVQLDPARLYIFGNSMGGYLTYDAAMFDSQYYAAAAIHAMFIEPSYEGIVGKATRKIPVAIYMGDEDQFIPVAGVRRTRDLLLKEKFPVHCVELKRHDHNYYAISDKINADAWEFLKAVQVPPN
jgi:poly(3-hydroxybutyrate) depolymerase